MELVEPSVQYEDSFKAAVVEYRGVASPSGRSQWYREAPVTESDGDFTQYVERQRSFARGENLPAGYIPSSVFWLVDGEEFIGKIDIRHYLTEKLRAEGGHIGYDIRPSMRRRGYGTTILRLGLQKARLLGITRVLVTCDVDNIGSRKIIEANGGILDQENLAEKDATRQKLRFWIDV